MDYRERWELKDYLIGRRLERRIRLFRLATVAVISLFLVNFWYLQAVRGEDYAAMAENNRLRRLPTPPTRGVIFDRHGEVIASTRPSLDLLLDREGLGEIEPQLRRLAPVLGASYETLVEREAAIRRQPAHRAPVLREDVGLAELARIEARRELFPSIEVHERARRSYPDGTLFAHVLGYVGQVDEQDLAAGGGALGARSIVGKSGVERAYDERLRGRRGWNLVSVNSLGRPIGGSWVGREPVHGTDLRLTLDRGMQRALADGIGEEVGAGVFLDPWSGEVLAIYSAPGFDPNRFADGLAAEPWRALASDPRRPLHDRSIAGHYAPGSTFKIVMAIAGLETGTITPDERMHCGGSTKIYDRRRLCWKRGGHGAVDLDSALAHSCNVYFYHLGKRLGIDAIHEYGSRLGLGRPTGIGIAGEEPGILPSRAWKERERGEIWYPGDTISVAIGQGLLTVTPLQMARLAAAVATDGGLPRPHLVHGEHERLESVDVGRESLRLVRHALRRAVADGTGGEAELPGIAVAGKTGTAQVYRHSAGVDSNKLPKHERDHAWFVGYAPAEHPRVAFAVIVEHGGHGGSAAAPVVRRVLERFFAPRPPRDATGDDGLRAGGDDGDPPPAG